MYTWACRRWPGFLAGHADIMGDSREPPIGVRSLMTRGRGSPGEVATYPIPILPVVHPVSSRSPPAGADEPSNRRAQ